jgi:hypothetical protein
MIGINEISFCKAQMIEVAQEYVDKHFVDSVKVTDVESSKKNYSEDFIIKFEGGFKDETKKENLSSGSI